MSALGVQRPLTTSKVQLTRGLLHDWQRRNVSASMPLALRRQPDGYLNCYVQVSGEPRFTRLAWSHEMYCAGHLIQAAIAFHRGAGDPRLLDIATRVADNLVSEFAGKENGLDGHPIIETALAELYRETGTDAYLSLARQFVDQRGHGLAGDSGLGRRYLQDHMPVRELVTEIGHVVRALYLEAGVTDVAVETASPRRSPPRAFASST